MEKKVQRLVRKTIATAILLLCSFSYAQDNIGKRELIVLNKIIDDLHQESPKIAFLSENPSNLNEGELKKYYDYRYEGKISAKIVLDMKDGEMIYDTDENNEKFAKMFFSKYTPLDLYFTQSELKKALEQKKQPRWKAKDFKNTKILREKNKAEFSYENVFVYSLSRPFFSSDRNFMAVQVITIGPKFLYIYKLENDNWIKIERIHTTY